MNELKSILLIGIFIWTSALKGQDYVDVAKFHYASTPENNFDSILGATTIEEFGADITLPIPLNDSNTILTGFYLEQIKTQFNPLIPSEKISTIQLKMGFNRKHSSKVSGTYMLLPKISSNLEESSSKDFQFGALALFKLTKNEYFKYNAGIYYNGELFGPFIVPLFGFYYKSPNDKFEANFTLPIWADANYRLTNWLNIGANFTAFVRSYNLSDYNSYIVKKTNEIFGYLQFNLGKSILLQTKVGYSVGRSYRVYNENDKVDFGLSAFRFGDERTVLSNDFSDGLVFKVRLLYRFNIEK